MEVPAFDVLLIPLVVLGAISIVVWRDARSHDLNPLGWSVFVFFFAILGVPAYVIARYRQRRLIKASKPAWLCRVCGKYSNVDAPVCANCGATISP